MQNLSAFFPAGHFHSLNSTTTLFLFRDGFGGVVDGVREGALVMSNEGTRICAFSWYNGEQPTLFRLPVGSGTRYRYSPRETPQLRTLGLTEGRFSNVRKPECPQDTIGGSQDFVKSHVVRAMAGAEDNQQLSSTQKSQCLSAIGMQSSEYDKLKMERGTEARPAIETAP